MYKVDDVIIMPTALPWPLVGDFCGSRNSTRHMRISKEAIQAYGIMPISGWMEMFMTGLHPSGGPFVFLKGEDWRDGPLNMIFLSKAQEDASSWEPPESPTYTDYINAFLDDIKYMYRLNGWPNHGSHDNHAYNDDFPNPHHGKTIDEVMVFMRQKLRPWGGPWGYKWPKMNESPVLQMFTMEPAPEPWVQRNLYEDMFTRADNVYTYTDDGWVPDSCPWYEEHLQEKRRMLWRKIHQYDDPDVTLNL